VSEPVSSIASVKDRSSFLWMFYHPDEVAETEIVEVRLNGHDKKGASFIPPTSWNLHRIQWGNTFFVRRHQPMSELQIEEMLCEMLHFANEHQMQVHSWLTGPDLAPDGFQP